MWGSNGFWEAGGSKGEVSGSKGVSGMEGSKWVSEVWVSNGFWEVEGSKGVSELSGSKGVSEMEAFKGSSETGGSCESLAEGSFEEGCSSASMVV